MDNLHRLQEIFAHFPGIGPRQARRFVYFLLNKPATYVKEFTDLVKEVSKSASECADCHRFFINQSANTGTPNSPSTAKICNICADNLRDRSTIMIVARDSDFESVERSGAYKGLYFILGGTVPVLDKDPEKRIRLRQLLERLNSLQAELKGQSDAQIKEVILSLNTTQDGEHTADIVKSALDNLFKSNAPKITVLGRGLSTGAELEYVDGDTIKNALKNRH